MTTNRREFINALGTVTAAGAARHELVTATAQERSRAAPSVPTDLCFASGRELCALIRARKVSARDVMTAHLRQIDRLNPKLERASSRSCPTNSVSRSPTTRTDVWRVKEPVGPLHGLPWAFKDLEAAVGFPFTSGSPINKSLMPAEDSVLVDRLRTAGVIPIGKTNVPEFGMGSHSYNTVYGTTVNPYDLTKSAGGSSGGAGAALAAGLLPLADGSDLGRIAAQPWKLQQRRWFPADGGPGPNGAKRNCHSSASR